MSSISQFIYNLYCWIYCSYTWHILFHSEIKITLFCLFSFAFIRFHSLHHMLPFVFFRYHSLYHSFSFLAPHVTIRFLLLSLVISLVVIRCHSLYHSLSLDVPLVCLFINDHKNFWVLARSIKPLMPGGNKKVTGT